MNRKQQPLYKKCIHYYYFHKSYNNDENDIRDIWFRNEYFKDWTIKQSITDVSDPFYLDKEGNPIIGRENINNIKYITLGICRPTFRKSVFSQLMIDKTYNRCIFHFYIKKWNQGIYVCSWLLKKTSIKRSQKDTKAELAWIIKKLPWYLSQDKKYADYSYKKTTENDDPLLIFNRLIIREPISDIDLKKIKSPVVRGRRLEQRIKAYQSYKEYCQNYINNHDIPKKINPSDYNKSWKSLFFMNGKKFNSFKQTQNSCPFAIRSIDIND